MLVTRRLLARAALGAAALLAVAAAGAAPAYAATGTITGYTPNDDGTLTIAFSSPDLAEGTTIDPASVVVTIAGEDVPATAVPAAQSDVRRVSFLTMDISGSMRGQKMTDAKTAANAYLDALPADVEVGLVAFNNEAQLLVPATTDRAQVRTAVDGLTPRGATSLRDGILLAIDNLGTEGLRNQLVLSDGGDTTSTATVEETLAQITASGTVVDAVSIDGTAAEDAQLAALTAAGNGSVVTAGDTDAIVSAFEAAAGSQSNALVVTATVPPGSAGSQTITVTADAGGEQLTASIVGLLPESGGATPTPDVTEAYGPVPVATPDAGIFGTSWILPAALAALGIGLFVLLGVALLATDRDSQTTGRVRRRLSRYSLASRDRTPAEGSTALGQGPVARSAVEFAGRVTQSRDLDTMLGTKLEAAGVPLKPPEWLLIHVGITLGAGLVFMLLSGFGLLATLLGLVLGFAGPQIYLMVKEGRRKSQFQTQLPGTLQLLAGSLAAGYSLPQAVDTVVRESDGPMAAELNRAIVEARLGVPMEDALETVARRMDSVDFAWVVMAIRIQREVGGNLSEVLSSVAATMRERERLRRQVEVLSAEGRLSAIILGFLPIMFILYLALRRPEYLSVLFTTPLGLVMCVVGVVLLIAGAFWLRKVVKVEV